MRQSAKSFGVVADTKVEVGCVQMVGCGVMLPAGYVDVRPLVLVPGILCLSTPKRCFRRQEACHPTQACSGTC